MQVVSNFLKKHNAKNIVVDPVMYAKNGDALMDIKNMHSLIEKIIPLADIITPNIAEAEHLANMKIDSIEDMKEASRQARAGFEKQSLEMSSVSTRLGRKTIEMHNISKSFNGITYINDFSYIF
jgi:hydroxymethylpyrimidine/phosphomethylpyrimidine kinase